MCNKERYNSFCYWHGTEKKSESLIRNQTPHLRSEVLFLVKGSYFFLVPVFQWNEEHLSLLFTFPASEMRIRVIETCDQTCTGRVMFNKSSGCSSLVVVINFTFSNETLSKTIQILQVNRFFCGQNFEVIKYNNISHGFMRLFDTHSLNKIIWHSSFKSFETALLEAHYYWLAWEGFHGGIYRVLD